MVRIPGGLVTLSADLAKKVQKEIFKQASQL